jgi:hypothetical protein
MFVDMRTMFVNGFFFSAKQALVPVGRWSNGSCVQIGLIYLTESKANKLAA